MKIRLSHKCKKLEGVLSLLEKWDREGIKVAESPEVAAFRESVTSSLENIAADIQRLLDRPNGLSEEDKASLQAVADRAKAIAGVVPE